ncbi:unnamed protein product, partial [Polarella glacialis]
PTSVEMSLIKAAWRCVDHDGDGIATHGEVEICEALSPVAKKLLGFSALPEEKFKEALMKDKGGLLDSPEAVWAAVDSNQDGKVTELELEVAKRQNHISAGEEAVLLTADSNADGVLSRQEFQGALQGLGGGDKLGQAAWLIADREGSGYISPAQLTKLADWAGLSSHVFAAFKSAGDTDNRRGFFKGLAAAGIGAWPEQQQMWCCSYQGVCSHTDSPPITAPPPSVIQVPFNCHEGYGDWWLSWSATKTDWCCSHFGRGCAATLPPS